MNIKFPVPRRMIVCIVLAAVCFAVMVGEIFLTVHLTGYREIEDFSYADRAIFMVFIAAEIPIMLLYIAFVFGAARLALMRTCLIQKRQDRFGTADSSVIYQSCEDVWQDSGSGKRAIRYRQGKLLIVLIEQYDRLEEEWHPEEMRFYDSPAELEKSLKEEYALEWDKKPEVQKKDDLEVIRVSIEDTMD